MVHQSLLASAYALFTAETAKHAELILYFFLGGLRVLRGECKNTEP